MQCDRNRADQPVEPVDLKACYAERSPFGDGDEEGLEVLRESAEREPAGVE